MKKVFVICFILILTSCMVSCSGSGSAGSGSADPGPGWKVYETEGISFFVKTEWDVSVRDVPDNPFYSATFFNGDKNSNSSTIGMQLNVLLKEHLYVDDVNEYLKEYKDSFNDLKKDGVVLKQDEITIAGKKAIRIFQEARYGEAFIPDDGRLGTVPDATKYTSLVFTDDHDRVYSFFFPEYDDTDNTPEIEKIISSIRFTG